MKYNSGMMIKVSRVFIRMLKISEMVRLLKMGLLRMKKVLSMVVRLVNMMGWVCVVVECMMVFFSGWFWVIFSWMKFISRMELCMMMLVRVIMLIMLVVVNCVFSNVCLGIMLVRVSGMGVMMISGSR